MKKLAIVAGAVLALGLVEELGDLGARALGLLVAVFS